MEKTPGQPEGVLSSRTAFLPEPPFFRPSPVLSAVEFCHHLLQSHLQPGDWAADATAGNGHDTLFLARQVGPAGKIFACDLQPEAVEATRALLAANGISPDCCELSRICHSRLENWLSPAAAGRLAAVIFNLGYLPGGDKSVITHTATSLTAATRCLEQLRPGGLLLVVLYPGHHGGDTEAAALRDWAATIPARTAHSAEFHTLNAKNPAPSVLIIQKSRRDSAG